MNCLLHQECKGAICKMTNNLHHLACGCQDCQSNTMELLRKENARLRDALEWIAADRSLTGETVQGMQRVARDALDGDK